MNEDTNDNIRPFKTVEGSKKDETVQKPRHFYFYFDRGVIHKEGYLICTPSFTAVVNGEGTIIFAATLEHLIFVDAFDEPLVDTTNNVHDREVSEEEFERVQAEAASANSEQI